MRAGATGWNRIGAGDGIRNLRAALRVVKHALREVFDEAAYARYLEQTGVTASRESYAAFWRERSAQGRPRPRCC
jgi:hypothetical protein